MIKPTPENLALIAEVDAQQQARLAQRPTPDELAPARVLVRGSIELDEYDMDPAFAGKMACNEESAPTEFFDDYPKEDPTPDEQLSIIEALKICRTCKVLLACQTNAYEAVRRNIETGVPIPHFGIRGGMTEETIHEKISVILQLREKRREEAINPGSNRGHFKA